MDWRGHINKADQRRSQLTGEGAQTGLFGAFIETATGETQSGKFVYAGGERTIPLHMPFESATSWIRAIPENGSPVVAAYRADTQETVCINYYTNNPKDKLDAYSGGVNIYRPLLSGELEFNSSGMAQSYYSARPVLEQRAGIVRSWLDQDRLEAGVKAPLHSRYLWQHSSNLTGDEEHFGAVRRPYNYAFDPITFTPRTTLGTIAIALSSTSFNYFDYPIPDFTTPTSMGGSPASSNVAAATASEEAGVALLAIGEFKIRPFAKEYLKVIKNPLFGLNPAVTNTKLIDIREGQVYDDECKQVIDTTTGAYVRAKYEYHTPIDTTTFVIDEVGNVNWALSNVAFKGWNVDIPIGAFNLSASQDVQLTSNVKNVGIRSSLSTGIDAGIDFNVTTDTGGINLTAGFGFDTQVSSGDDTKTVSTGNLSIDVPMGNVTQSAGLNFTAIGLTKLVLEAPMTEIGQKGLAINNCVLGDSLGNWLTEFLSSFLDNFPFITVGNLGSPTPLNPLIQARLELLRTAIATPTINPWLSQTIKVSP